MEAVIALIASIIEKHGALGLALVVIGLMALKPHSFPWLVRRALNGHAKDHQAPERREGMERLLNSVATQQAEHKALGEKVDAHHEELHDSLTEIRNRLPDASLLAAMAAHIAQAETYRSALAVTQRDVANNVTRLNDHSPRLRAAESKLQVHDQELQGLKGQQSEIERRIIDARGRG